MICYRCGSVLGSGRHCLHCGANITVYRKIVRISNAYYNAALEQARVRNLTAAVASLERALEYDKKNTKARNLLGLIFYELGEITEADMNALTDLVVGLLKGDTEEMADGVLAIGTGSAGTDRNKLKEDLEALSSKYMNVNSLNDIDFSALLGEVCDLADRHHIVLPGRYTMLVRSFLTIEGVMEQLCPELNMFDVISNKLMDRMKKSFSLKKEILSLGEGVLDAGKKVSRIPQLIADTLSDIMKGRLKVNLELTGYEDLINELNNKINDLILVIVGCVLFSGGCKLCTAKITPVAPNGMPLFALIILIAGISIIIFALKRIFRKK